MPVFFVDFVILYIIHMYDILIKNGFIVDGTGDNAFFKADIAISSDKIEKIEPNIKSKAKTIIDAEGLYVSPGFIDINNHSDTTWALISDPALESMIRQGVTTIIGGQCGSSLAPLTRGSAILAIQKWTDVSEANVNWTKISEFLKQIEKQKPSINFATLVGHNTLRRSIIKESFRELVPEEIAKIKFLLEEAFSQGAFGFSTGLLFSHEYKTPSSELIELAKLTAKYNRIYTCHLRGEAGLLLSSINENIRISRESGVSLEISHLKAMGRKYWNNMKKAIEMIESARQDGLNINFDIYPYNFTGSVLYTLLPAWAAEGGKKELLKRLRNPSEKEKIINEMKENEEYDYDKVMIATVFKEKTYVGKKIAEIAINQEVSLEEAILNILIANEGRVIAFIDTLLEENVEMGLKHYLSFVGSDGSGYNIKNAAKFGLVHPRSFGSYPRALAEYVRERKIIRLEEMIYKMTGGPAHKLGLKQRGLLKKDYFADIVIFDFEKVTDKATKFHPHIYPEGINWVIVNGTIAVEKGNYNGARPGKVLRK